MMEVILKNHPMPVLSFSNYNRLPCTHINGPCYKGTIPFGNSKVKITRSLNMTVLYLNLFYNEVYYYKRMHCTLSKL